jgi:hypothetical protein
MGSFSEVRRIGGGGSVALNLDGLGGNWKVNGVIEDLKKSFMGKPEDGRCLVPWN